jgi:hypothetical protein
MASGARHRLAVFSLGLPVPVLHAALGIKTGRAFRLVPRKQFIGRRGSQCHRGCHKQASD